jgi:hypothetical protein
VRGYPPIHLLILMLAFGAMAVPLVNLTTARTVTFNAPKAEQAAGLHKTHLALRFAHAPKTISLKMGEQEFFKDPALKASPVETQADVAIPADGVEFVLTSEWPEGTPDTALTLEIEPDGLDTKTETRWSIGSTLTEVISFQWK